MKATNIIGWSAVALATVAATFWAFWGVIEAFHEGWCKPQLWMRLLQLLAYLAPATVICGLAFVGIRWPHLGAALFSLVGVVIALLVVIDRATFSLDILILITAIPVILGVMFLFGRPRPKRAAYLVSLGLPLLTLVLCGIEPVARVSTRHDDGNRGSRLVEGKGVRLLWAPDGPGWSRNGNVTWQEALHRAQYLSEDGDVLADTPQNIWRLPTREEVVRSLTRHDRNAGGAWDASREQANYRRRPDKESPLWDPYSPLIYLWTADELDEQHAWIVVYHGGIYAKPKNIGSPSFGFRAVRDPPTEH